LWSKRYTSLQFHPKVVTDITLSLTNQSKLSLELANSSNDLIGQIFTLEGAKPLATVTLSGHAFSYSLRLNHQAGKHNEPPAFI
jgi:hypothetical protein